MAAWQTLPTKTIEILISELEYRIENNDPHRDDSRKYGDNWVENYQNRIDEYHEELDKRNHESNQ
jgi:hypothetical protein